MDIRPDEASTGVIPEKPRSVQIAIIMLYSYLVLSAIAVVFGFYNSSRTNENFSFSRGLLCWAVLIPIYLILVYQVSKGKIFARNLLLFWFIWIALLFFWLSYRIPTLLATPSMFLVIFGLVATILLYLGPSKAWFEYHKKEKKA